MGRFGILRLAEGFVTLFSQLHGTDWHSLKSPSPQQISQPLGVFTSIHFKTAACVCGLPTILASVISEKPTLKTTMQNKDII
jgi:hypothetical protein